MGAVWRVGLRKVCRYARPLSPLPCDISPSLSSQSVIEINQTSARQYRAALWTTPSGLFTTLMKPERPLRGSWEHEQNPLSGALDNRDRNDQIFND